MELEGKSAVVVGMARSGVAAAEFLLGRGARVVAADRKPAAELPPGVTRLREKGAILALGAHDAATFTAADLVQWWTVTGGIVVTTASTWEQVKRLLWGEVHKSYAASRYPLGGELLQTELKFAPDCYAIGLSTNEGVRFQGFHGRVFVVIDEAPGVRPEIWEAIEGIRAGGDVRVLALGNPTVRGGPFYDAFTTDRHEWATFTIDAFDTPNLAGLTLDDLSALSDEELDHNVRPYLVTRRWVLEKFRAWGESSPLWKARVRGQFPDTSEDAVIPLSWVEQAHQRWREWDAAGRPSGFSCVGVDVGESGDSTVLALRHDDVIAELRYAPHGDHGNRGAGGRRPPAPGRRGGRGRDRHWRRRRGSPARIGPPCGRLQCLDEVGASG